MIRNHPSRGGWIEVICGPMFSGKSEELIRRLRRAEIAGQRVLIAKAQIDDRYDISHVVSHSGHRIRAVGVEDPASIERYADGCDVVGIDEIQFFDPSVVETCVRLADRGLRVIAAGLDTDFRAEPFGPMPELLARAEIVDKLGWLTEQGVTVSAVPLPLLSGVEEYLDYSQWLIEEVKTQLP